MYAALLKKRLVLAISEANLIYEGTKILNCEKYYCPNCKKRVMLVISQEKMPFFKHIRLIKGEGEKDEHQQAKQLLCASLVANGIKAEMEVPLANQQLRADIMAFPNLAFEVQCAPLSKEEFQHRHSIYKKIKVKDVWIVGQRHYLKKKLRKSQRIFLRYSKIWDWYYLEIDPFKEEIYLKYQIRLEPLRDNVMYRKKTFSLSENGLKELFSFRGNGTVITYVDGQKQRNYLIRQLRQKTNLGRKIATLMYESHVTIDDFPSQVFDQVRLPNEKLTVIKFLQNKRDTS
ncbi:competence protein CoiA family protein [Lactobacillus sp.]|uniref:competence protein CoiA n=1 Tax=Lactobacillus sp. TaxID=1591 RepID=UPI0019BB5F6D|nr:competence protein CoiA family protein [Lactobacillus sp.]MBD5430329.1 competence protein [Lactobacillus sp.]